MHTVTFAFEEGATSYTTQPMSDRDTIAFLVDAINEALFVGDVIEVQGYSRVHAPH